VAQTSLSETSSSENSCPYCKNIIRPDYRVCPYCKADLNPANTSGQRLSAIVPFELQGWNWGAFLLTWIWGIGNSVWMALLALIPFPLVALAIACILGVKGNEWAWQSKRWDSIEQFRKTQRTWMIWGIIALLAPIVLLIGIALIAVGLLGYYHVISI
jgi:hypothetical protein